MLYEEYILVVQEKICEGFEKTLNSLHSSEKYDIYVTGSNAFLLSSDLATLFTGRTFSIEVFPFSLREYMEYYELKDSYEAYTQYRKIGEMSGAYVYLASNDKYYLANPAFRNARFGNRNPDYGSVSENLVEIELL